MATLSPHTLGVNIPAQLVAVCFSFKFLTRLDLDANYCNQTSYATVMPLTFAGARRLEMH